MPMQDIMDIPTMGMDIMDLDTDTMVDAATILEPLFLVLENRISEINKKIFKEITNTYSRVSIKQTVRLASRKVCFPNARYA